MYCNHLINYLQQTNTSCVLFDYFIIFILVVWSEMAGTNVMDYSSKCCYLYIWWLQWLHNDWTKVSDYDMIVCSIEPGCMT